MARNCDTINYKLRQQVKQDIKKIGRYTFKKYGKSQRDKYYVAYPKRLNRWLKCHTAGNYVMTLEKATTVISIINMSFFIEFIQTMSK